MAESPEDFSRQDAAPERAETPGDSGWQAIAESLFGVEARSHVLRYAMHLVVIGIGGAAVWLAGMHLPEKWPGAPAAISQQAAVPIGVETPAPALAVNFIPAEFSLSADIFRLAQIHTDIPSRPRNEIQTYVVQPGDTLFGIAQKFGLTPETIIWSNRLTLQDDPHSLRPGMEFHIPPVNGVLYQVQPGDTLKGIADGTHVAEFDIVDWPGNQLDPDNAQISAGQFLVIPGGTGKLYQWQPPVIPRKSRNVVSQSDGAGACPGGYSGATGSGYFVWPADTHYLSGADFTSYHAGIDIAAGLGQAIYATDGGVVVWAGPNNYGYGNLVIIDHGNGWQSLYGHLSQWNVSCGQSVRAGQVVGLAGSTGRSSGPHLHFETAYNGVRINPWSVLPAP